ncbi:uncharacterized protein LOC136084796 [Hydra vulgaris]|uniref:Uncharacterized protein LOC136084796 n=1 Tax=Hydra vulgaris TaxID=6087 RepID=A0ABM4CJ91_HYDVU
MNEKLINQCRPDWSKWKNMCCILFFTAILCILLSTLEYYKSEKIFKNTKGLKSWSNNSYTVLWNNLSKFFNKNQLNSFPLSFNANQSKFPRFRTTKKPWDSLPSFELNIRLTSIEPRWFWTYQRWFLKSLKLFWPQELYNLTIVLNAELTGDRLLGDQIASMWPFPKVVYIEKPITIAIGDKKNSDRFRMYYDAFFPDLYTEADFIGFVDTDTLFITPVTPQSLFEGNKPIVIGIAGNVYYASCTEFMLKVKQLMICMSYFPVTIKVVHLVLMRAHIEKLHGKNFSEVFGEAVLRVGGGTDGCLCQFAVMCNYIYRFHRDEYSFRIQMHPDNSIKNDFPESEKVPFPRVAIHSRHIIPYKVVDPMAKDSMILFNERIKEGMCRAFGIEWCPNIYCAEFSNSSLHKSLYAFEYYDWSWDKRCSEEQEKHYLNVRNLIDYQIKNKAKLFGTFENHVSSCMFF